jgi:transposase
VGQGRLGPGKKNVRRLKAGFAFLDESGLLMAPLVRRTWAPQGKTPILRQPGRHREKVSAIGVLTVSPRRRRVGLYAAFYPNQNVNDVLLQAFLAALIRHLRYRLYLVWDRLNVHRSRRIASFLDRHRRLRRVYLPPYAPELNPVEPLWSYLKMNPLANHVPDDVEQLARHSRRASRRIRRRPDLLRAFLRESPLSSRLV